MPFQPTCATVHGDVPRRAQDDEYDFDEDEEDDEDEDEEGDEEDEEQESWQVRPTAHVAERLTLHG
jgi:hypothetical protein